jgi:hypothetical protein
MATETSKRVTKKAPAKKKAAAKKPVANKAAVRKPLAKKAVAKKAAVRKPLAKKAVAKKAVAKKATVKKAVTKKAVAKKAVAKKAVAKKATVKKAVAKRVTAPIATSPITPWLNKEPALPVFLQNQTPEIKKDPVATQKYNQKKNNSPKYILIVVLVLLLGLGVNSFDFKSGKDDNSDGKNNSASSLDVSGTNGENDSASDDANAQSENSASQTPSTKSTAAASPKSSPVNAVSATPSGSAASKVTTQAPRTFTSVASEQGAVLKWLAPKNIGKVVAFELYGRAVGQSDWVLLSTVTIEQLDVEVELTPSDSNTEFRVASLLDNDKQIFNKTIIALPGSLT